MAKKRKLIKPRNFVALALRDTKPGNHGDQRKQESKRKCRQKVRIDD